MSRLRPIVYLHLLRTWRYKYSFINSTFNITFWIAIFILGALLFVPEEELATTGPYVFWGVTLWNIISTSVWYIAGWSIWFFVSLGLVEDHMLHNTRTLYVLAGRLVTIATQVAMVTPFMYLLVSYATGARFPLAVKPLFLLYGLATATVMAVSYGLILSAISLRTGVPGPLLDITNFLIFIVGGVAVPVAMLPGPLRSVAVAIPYSHAAEVMRYGAAGLEPYLPLTVEVAVSGIVAAAMAAVAYILFTYLENKYIRIHGVRGVGRM